MDIHIELLNLGKEADENSLNFVREVANKNHHYLANLYSIKMRIKNGEEILEDFIPYFEKAVNELIKTSVKTILYQLDT